MTGFDYNVLHNGQVIGSVTAMSDGQAKRLAVQKYSEGRPGLLNTIRTRQAGCPGRQLEKV